MYIVKRSTHNPLLSPLPDTPWEAVASFNGCPIKKGKELHLLYRALSRPDPLLAPGGLSTIGKATSLDGGNTFGNREQLIAPEEPWEKHGCEDPRVTFFEGQYIIFYTALGGLPFGPGNIKVACALSKDLKKIDEKHLVTPFNAKAMTLFPERIGGKITALFSAHTDEPPSHMALVQCDQLQDLWDLAFWERWHAGLETHILDPLRSGNDHAEVGAAPIKTKDGWLLIYSYFQNYYEGEERRVTSIEALLLDLENPQKIIGRTKYPLMTPEEIYEKYGVVPNVVFPSGCLLEKNKLELYYGGADTVCAKASIYLPDLLEALLPQPSKPLVVRAKENPILAPTKQAWESRAVFNTAAIELDGTIHLLYRAMGEDNTSVFGYATTKNGSKIVERDTKPIYLPREDFELKKGGPGSNSGCEDPRITKLDNTLYVTYTAYDGVQAPHSALTSILCKDFLAKRWNTWTKPILITPDNVDDKDTCILPEKVDGKYMVIHRIQSNICADFVDSLDFTKNRITRCIEMLGPRRGMWDSERIGAAGPPFKTEQGWILLYHGFSGAKRYAIGAVLLDLKNPTIVLSRTIDPIFEAVEEYEKIGQIENVVFSCGSVVRDDTLLLYYGAADTVVGVAKLSIKRLLKILAPENLA
jgi:beta-1,2-mannobiose phosphorylase / 1,2-beta-oligomannan phosphorylase